MDPTQTLADLLMALDNDQPSLALACWYDLRTWLKGGGYAPGFSQALALMTAHNLKVVSHEPT